MVTKEARLIDELIKKTKEHDKAVKLDRIKKMSAYIKDSEIEEDLMDMPPEQVNTLFKIYDKIWEPVKAPIAPRHTITPEEPAEDMQSVVDALKKKLSKPWEEDDEYWELE